MRGFVDVIVGTIMTLTVIKSNVKREKVKKIGKLDNSCYGYNNLLSARKPCVFI